MARALACARVSIGTHKAVNAADQSNIPVNSEDDMRRSYMDYAMSVIVGRALPDIRDGGDAAVVPLRGIESGDVRYRHAPLDEEHPLLLPVAHSVGPNRPVPVF